MSTLVTGAVGTIGAWVVREVAGRGRAVGGLRPHDDPWRMRMIVGPDVARRLTIERGDTADRERVTQAVRERGVRCIVHLAGWQIPLCRPHRDGRLDARELA